MIWLWIKSFRDKLRKPTSRRYLYNMDNELETNPEPEASVRFFVR